jgi:hypothetical protein
MEFTIGVTVHNVEIKRLELNNLLGYWHWVVKIGQEVVCVYQRCLELLAVYIW